VATTNAGDIWFMQELPGDLADADDIWCDTTGNCRAVGIANDGGVAILANESATRAASRAPPSSGTLRRSGPMRPAPGAHLRSTRWSRPTAGTSPRRTR
jgi:hypothetical protein